MKTMQSFYSLINEQLEKSLNQEEALQKAIDIMSDSILKGGVIHVFGCGHSQMFGEELCFRTGGLVPINAIMIPQYNIYPKTKYSQLMERTEGFAKGVLEEMLTSVHDTMIIVSISGRNAAGVDMAIAAREMGLKVITLTSLDYTQNVTSRHSSGKLVKDYSDVVIDLCGVKGDAALSHESVSEKFCSPSTIIGMSILVGIMGEVIVKLAESGINPPIWVSGNLDRGDAINSEHIRNYKDKIDIL